MQQTLSHPRQSWRALLSAVLKAITPAKRDRADFGSNVKMTDQLERELADREFKRLYY